MTLSVETLQIPWSYIEQHEDVVLNRTQLKDINTPNTEIQYKQYTPYINTTTTTTTITFRYLTVTQRLTQSSGIPHSMPTLVHQLPTYLPNCNKNIPPLYQSILACHSTTHRYLPKRQVNTSKQTPYYSNSGYPSISLNTGG